MLRFLLPLAVLLAGAPAAAQGRTLVFLPDGASSRLEEALRVELQLSGRRVAFARGEVHSGAARELAWLSSGEVVVVRLRRGGAEIVVVSRSGPSREHLSTASDRAVALVALALLEGAPPPVEPAHETNPDVRLESPRRPSAPGWAQGGSLSNPRPNGPVMHVPNNRGLRGELASELSLLPVAERIGFEVLGALLSGAALAIGGALVADASAGNDRSFPWWAVGLTVMGTVGATTGTFAAGRLTGAQGDPYWTLGAGILGGTLAGLLLLVGNLTDVRPDDGVTSGWTYFGAALAAVLPTTLSVLAFESTISDPSSAVVRVTPTSVSGRF